MFPVNNAQHVCIWHNQIPQTVIKCLFIFPIFPHVKPPVAFFQTVSGQCKTQRTAFFRMHMFTFTHNLFVML